MHVGSRSGIWFRLFLGFRCGSRFSSLSQQSQKFTQFVAVWGVLTNALGQVLRETLEISQSKLFVYPQAVWQVRIQSPIGALARQNGLFPRDHLNVRGQRS